MSLNVRQGYIGLLRLNLFLHANSFLLSDTEIRVAFCLPNDLCALQHFRSAWASTKSEQGLRCQYMYFNFRFLASQS